MNVVETAVGHNQNRIARTGPLLWVSLGGGEPFLRADLPEELESIIMRALERNPVHRYPTALALQQSLEALNDAEGASAMQARLDTYQAELQVIDDNLDQVINVDLADLETEAERLADRLESDDVDELADMIEAARRL